MSSLGRSARPAETAVRRRVTPAVASRAPLARPSRFATFAVLASLALAAAGLAPALARAESADTRLDRLSEEFITRTLTRRPQLATRLGLHDRDHALFPVTQASLGEDREWLHGFQDRLHDVPRAQL